MMDPLHVVLRPQGLIISWRLPGLWRPKAQESRMCIILVKASQKASADQEKENRVHFLMGETAKPHCKEASRIVEIIVAVLTNDLPYFVYEIQSIFKLFQT